MGIWRLPFDGNLKPYEEGQQFGQTSYPRGRGYFHDGYDFGSAKYSGDFKAVNDGKVIYAGYYGSGIGYAIVLQIGEYQVMYQEFGNTYYVKTGDQVTVGQPLGRLTSTHLHLGITKKNWQLALSSWDIDDGTWLNPIPILTSGDSTDEDTENKRKGMMKMFAYMIEGRPEVYGVWGNKVFHLTSKEMYKDFQNIVLDQTGKECKTYTWKLPNNQSTVDLISLMAEKVNI
ncbi:M23 family metallopeptidase [Enterococcus faecium]|uniref:M23 family metallopeptidase n=1 Tax=Enterococcus TaxID=1350 RepID=UPI00223C4AF7|nr:M23 family metallopeptidase [Enterococcus faecium]MCS8591648.1 M23 family metallopeptidase [Enterococcus faecium]